MARPLRLSFDDAYYHITSGGNRKENMFYTDNDRLVFLEKLNQTLRKYSFVCYAYSLMDYAAVPQAVRRFKGLIEKDERAKMMKQEIEKEIG